MSSKKDTPIIAGRTPISVELEAGKSYYWCSCGRSQEQPFCDGSHRGTNFTPVEFIPEESAEAHICMCKITENAPYCDGSHARLDEENGDNIGASGGGMPQAAPTPEEPTVKRIHDLARHGLEKVGHHGELVAMGVPRPTLPQWDDIQILPAQLANRPLLDGDAVGTDIVIGPRAKRPLRLDIPIFVSDMSFGSLSEEAKVSLAAGAELAGAAIASGEGGMLPEEQKACSRYLFELGSAKFGYDETILDRVQAFHFKAGQGAKTGTGGHLPASKVVGKVAQVRGLAEGVPAISPAAFSDLKAPKDFKRFGDRVRELTGGIPIGMKMSANHIEDDVDFALECGVDYIILDGRGGGTGAAPRIFRDHISVPTIPALARARHWLDKRNRADVTLIVTGGLRMPEDFVKALCLGADCVAIANSALQAIGCIAARMCNTGNCPVGIATQKPDLRDRLNMDEAAQRLNRFLRSSVDLMSVLARACGHSPLNAFVHSDIATWKREMSELAGIAYSGYLPIRK